MNPSDLEAEVSQILNSPTEALQIPLQIPLQIHSVLPLSPASRPDLVQWLSHCWHTE
jgi:hypothetical protein